MHNIVIADNQAIFRAGAVRVIAAQEDMRIVAECSGPEPLLESLPGMPAIFLLLARTLGVDMDRLTPIVRQAESHIILLVENGEQPPASLLGRVDFHLSRSTTGDALVDCIRRIGRGERCMDLPATPLSASDAVGARVLERLTPRELQIVGFIVQGLKNRQIAGELNTQEQVIKNYLRSVYDKTGVSDRLELALFVLHHRVLAEAASRAIASLQLRTA